MRLFRTDRSLDLSFVNYLPLSRIINTAKVSTKDDIQYCLDYLPIASSKERALIFASFYIYIKRLYRDGIQWGVNPNSLDEEEEQSINKPLKAMRRASSEEDALRRRWQ